MERDVAVLIPAHNEADAIGRLVAALRGRFATVVVVDDGSVDDTAGRAGAAGATVLRHPACRGKGAALATGCGFLSRFGAAAVITMDGDGQHLVEDTAVFVRAFRRRPRVAVWVGARDLGAAQMPAIRKLTNRVMSLLISLVALQWMPDTQSGFRLFRRDALVYLAGVRSRHFEAESEVLIRASWGGLRVGAVPVATVYGSEKSKIRPVRDTLRFFRMLGAVLFPPLGRVWK